MSKPIIPRGWTASFLTRARTLQIRLFDDSTIYGMILLLTHYYSDGFIIQNHNAGWLIESAIKQSGILSLTNEIKRTYKDTY